jgi:hypothetical protein
LEGRRYGRLVVIKEASGSIPKRRKWLCQCDCGKTKEVRQDHLSSGATTSCGCVQKERAAASAFKGNEARQRGSEVYVKASNTGTEFVVDKEDWDRLKKHTWYETPKGYFQSRISGRLVRIHRFILGVTDEKNLVDHINRKKTDNRKSNLRIVNAQQNQWNRATPRNNQSGHRGIFFVAKSSKWRVTIQNKVIGHYDTYEKAVEVRLQEEKKRYGKYAPEVD